MPRAAKKNAKRTTSSSTAVRKPFRREVASLVLFLLSVITFLGLFKVDAFFVDWICTGARILMGWGFYVLPFSLLVSSVILLFHRGRPVMSRVVCILLVPFFIGAFLHLFMARSYEWSWNLPGELIKDTVNGTGGGLLAGLLSLALEVSISKVGAAIVFVVTLIFLVLSSLNLSIVKLYDMIATRLSTPYEPEDPPARPKKLASGAQARAADLKKRPLIDIPLDHPSGSQNAEQPKQGFFRPRPSEIKTPDEAISPNDLERLQSKEDAEALSAPPLVVKGPVLVETPHTEPLSSSPAASKSKPSAEPVVTPEIDASVHPGASSYLFPPLSLLSTGEPGSMIDATDELKANAQRLIETIHSFGIDVKMTNVLRGPTVTRYELEMDKGIKLSRLTSLSDDIALSLGASGVRIAPIPDKISVVGIEVPNKLVSTVYLRDILDSPEFAGAKSSLAFAIGKNIAGENVVGDIAKFPHMLIAGTTGSGKSVCMNSLLVSLLYKSSPEDVRLIMIDPKMIELGMYNGIPHLLIPVVTDPKKAAGALQWAVGEMMRRYKLFSERNVRDIFSYNQAILNDPENEMPKLPQVVIVIDELADLMLVAAKEVEESICRIAQMARAAGMHLIIATQRPSADVITGIMKANIPSRIAFAVASSLESRIILDIMGAEKLVGRGDMLYFPLGAPKPMRVQGTLITSSEVEAVVEYIKKNANPDYSDEIIDEIERQAENTGKKGSSSSDTGNQSDDADELLSAAVEVIMETGQASVSMLQRRLKLGYARAARLIDQMEQRGIVGPFEGSKPRQLLITRDQWREMQLVRGEDFLNAE